MHEGELHPNLGWAATGPADDASRLVAVVSASNRDELQGAW